MDVVDIVHFSSHTMHLIIIFCFSQYVRACRWSQEIFYASTPLLRMGNGHELPRAYASVTKAIPDISPPGVWHCRTNPRVIIPYILQAIVRLITKISQCMYDKQYVNCLGC